MKAIMKRAWEIFRTLTGDHIAKLAMALRQAWAEKKNGGKKEKIMKKQFTGNVTMQYHINERASHDVEFRMWENYGKKRIYFESKAIKGYIDCNNNNEIVITKKSYSDAKKVIEDFINTYDF